MIFTMLINLSSNDDVYRLSAHVKQHISLVSVVLFWITDKVLSVDVKNVSWLAWAEAMFSYSRAWSESRPGADFIVQRISRTYCCRDISMSLQHVDVRHFTLHIRHNECQLNTFSITLLCIMITESEKRRHRQIHYTKIHNQNV